MAPTFYIAGNTRFAGPVAVNPTAPASWQTLKIGGGGFVTGIMSHAASGKLAVKIDVFGGYVGSSTPGTQWKQLATSAGLPAVYQGSPYSGGGCCDVCLDPNDASGNTIYMLYAPYIGGGNPTLTSLLVSTDGGTTFSTTTFSPIALNANTSDASRLCGQRIAVDPANANIIYVGSATSLWVTTTGPQGTWSTVAGVANATSDFGICGIIFDSANGTTGGATNRILVSSNGNGVYVTENAGSTWTKITSSPTGLGRATLGPDGQYYIDIAGGGLITRITAGDTVGGTISISGDTNWAIALDPVNAAHAYGVELGGFPTTFSSSVNSGSPAGGVNASVAVSATDAPWLQLIGSTAWAPGNIIWDPMHLVLTSTSITVGTGTISTNIGANRNVAVNDILRFWATGALTNWIMGKVTAYNSGSGALTLSVGGTTSGGQFGAATGGSGTFTSWDVIKERVWLSSGAAVFYIDAPTSSGTVTYHSVTYGIENCVGTNAVWAPGGPVVATNLDTAILVPQATDPRLQTGAAGAHPLASTNTTTEGTRCDVAINDSTYWVACNQLNLVGSGPLLNGFSHNASTPAAVGTPANGNVTTWQNWASAPSVRGYIKCSTPTNTVILGYQAGACVFTTNGGTSWTTATGAPACPAGANWNWPASDYLAKDWVTSGTFYATNGAHIFRSTDGGANWTQGAAITAGLGAFLLQLRSVPSQAGHLFFTAGSNQGGGSSASLAALKSSHPLTHSPLVFSSDGGVTVNTLSGPQEVLSVGFSAAVGSYPCIAFVGWLGGVYGVWETSNFDPANPNAATWINIGPPLWNDLANSIDGSPNTPHLYSVSFQGSSFEIYGTSQWP